jgi:hypothetical protein
MFPLGSHHCPGGQFSGVGPTPSGKQALLNGSQYCPASHCAELTAGVAIVTVAIGVNAITAIGARRRTNFLTSSLQTPGRRSSRP